MSTEMQDVCMSDGCTFKAKIIAGDDPSKPLLLTRHGAPGLSNHQEPARSYGPFSYVFQILVSDLRGCGESDKQRPYTHKQWIQDLDELRQWAKADKIVFIGASHGGFLGLEYALAYPEHTAALMIGDTSAQMAHWGYLELFKRAMTDLRSKDVVDADQLVRIFSGTIKDMDDFRSAFASISPLYAVPGHLKAEADVDVDEFLAKIIAPVLETSNAAVGHCLSRYDVRDRLSELKLPVSIFCGRYDWITPVEHSEYLHKNISGSKLVIYEKSGHVAALEEKTKFSKEVRDFLAGANVPGQKV